MKYSGDQRSKFNMAVRIERCLPNKFSSAVEKRDETTKTTLDHVKRILTDHDYLGHSFPDESGSNKTAIVQDGVQPHATQMSVERGIQNPSGTCTSRHTKVESKGESSDEGIQASDLCSLLDKFEQAINNPSSVLTPATSPGCSENCNEPLTLKINSHENSTDLTPPATPPVQEKSEHLPTPNEYKPHRQVKKEKIPVDKSTKHKEDAKITRDLKFKKESTLLLISAHTNGQELKNCNTTNKRKSTDAVESCKETLSPSKKCKTLIANEKIDEDYQESKTVLQRTSSIVDESCVKIGKDELNIDVKNNNEDKMSKNCQKNKTELLETKSMISESCESIQNDKTKAGIASNDVKESLGNGNSSIVNDVTGERSRKLSGSTGMKYDIVHRKNNNELKMDSCKTTDNKDEPRGKMTQLNDSCKVDDHKKKSEDVEKTIKRKTGQYNNAIEDNRRNRRDASRSSSDSEDSSEGERSNRRDRRRSERHSETSKYSYYRERKKEKSRKYSSRDDCDYDRKYLAEEKRRHRKYDDNRNRHGRPWKHVRDIEHERKVDFRLGRSNIRDSAKMERRVIYVGGLPYGTTRDELWKRFRKFGPIERVSVHLRVGERDNYGFVTFFEAVDARDCIELGNSDPTEPHLDLCFGGRRQFCGGSYVDFDSTNSHIEELNETYGKICEELPEEDDFDSLLRMCQEGLGR